MGNSRKNPHVVPLPALDAPIKDQKVEFFLTASHQLKSPLAILQWCLQSALEDTTVAVPTKKLINQALEQANNMGHLVTDMLQVFRLIDPKDAQTLEAVELNPMIEQILTQYELVAHNRSVHLVRGAIENLPTVYGREMLLKQAIVNLVDNALKYTAKGGRVMVWAHTKKHNVEIVVEDQGIGISELDQKRLFTEFFRSQEARTMAYEGTGLGLVLVKHIAERFGGSVTCESKLHVGTTFTFSLPFK